MSALTYSFKELIEAFHPIFEIPQPEKDRAERLRRAAQSLGVVHVGRGMYSKRQGEIPTYMSTDTGDIVPVKKNHPRVNAWKKQQTQQPTVGADVPSPRVLAPKMSTADIEKFQADFLNFENKVLNDKLSSDVIKGMGQDLVDRGQIKKRVKNGKVEYLADESVSSIPRSFPRKHSVFLKKLEDVGVEIPAVGEVEHVAGSSSPFAPKKATLGAGSTRSTKLEAEIIKNDSGKEVGYKFGDYKESLNSELDNLVKVNGESDLGNLSEISVDKLRATETWKALRKEIEKDVPGLDAQTYEYLSDDFLGSELAKNRRIKIIMQHIMKSDGTIKGTALMRSDGLTVLQNLHSAFQSENRLSSVSKKKIKSVLDEIQSIFVNKKEFDVFNKKVIELYTLLSEEKGFTHLAPLTETICILASLVKGYSVVVPESSTFPVADHIAFRRDDSGKFVQVVLGNVKFGAGGASSALSRLYLGSLNGYKSPSGKYTNGVEIAGKLADLLYEPREIWRSSYKAHSEGSEAIEVKSTQAAAYEFSDILLESHGVDIRGATAEQKKILIDEMMSCWSTGGDWEFGGEGCSGETSYPEGVISEPCMSAWNVFRQRGKIVETVNNYLQFAEEYTSMVVQKKTGINEIDGRRSSILDTLSKKKHSGFKFVSNTGNYQSYDEKCKMPKSSYGMRTIENEK